MQKSKLFSLSVTLLVVALLLLAGPVNALLANLTLDNDVLTPGQTATFTLTLDTQGERLNINNITLSIVGPKITSCIFSASGQIISGCEGMNISLKTERPFGYGYGYDFGYGYATPAPTDDPLLPAEGTAQPGSQGGHNPLTPGYGYGYGYDYNYQFGKLIFTITLNTSQYPLGFYNTKLTALTSSSILEQSGPTFTITGPATPSGGGRRTLTTSTTCETTWTCTPYTQCVNGYQYRDCFLRNDNCTIFPDQPQIARACGFNTLSASNTETLFTEQNLPIPQNNTRTSISRITGSVIGPFDTTLADLFIAVLGMLLVIGGLTLLLVVHRHSIRKSFR